MDIDNHIFKLAEDDESEGDFDDEEDDEFDEDWEDEEE